MAKTANPPHSTAVWAFFGAGFWLIFVLFANFDMFSRFFTKFVVFGAAERF